MDIIRARQELLMGKTIYDMKLKVVDYSRCSTENEEQLKFIENQITKSKKLICSVKNWTHVGSYSDINEPRNGFLKMVEDAKLGKFDLIIMKQIFNLSRNINEIIKLVEQLLQYGVIIVTTSDEINTLDPNSLLILTSISPLAICDDYYDYSESM